MRTAAAPDRTGIVLAQHALPASISWATRVMVSHCMRRAREVYTVSSCAVLGEGCLAVDSNGICTQCVGSEPGYVLVANDNQCECGQGYYDSDSSDAYDGLTCTGVCLFWQLCMGGNRGLGSALRSMHPGARLPSRHYCDLHHERRLAVLAMRGRQVLDQGCGRGRGYMHR